MPYKEKAERTIRAVAHGAKLKKVKMSQRTAKKLEKHIVKRKK